ncbi:hypothetical protein [Aquiflexum sp.]
MKEAVSVGSRQSQWAGGSRRTSRKHRGRLSYDRVTAAQIASLVGALR